MQIKLLSVPDILELREPTYGEYMNMYERVTTNEKRQVRQEDYIGLCIQRTGEWVRKLPLSDGMHLLSQVMPQLQQMMAAAAILKGMYDESKIADSVRKH